MRGSDPSRDGFASRRACAQWPSVLLWSYSCSPSRRVALHAAWVRAGAQDAVRVAGDGAHAPERPGVGHLDVVPAAAQVVGDGGSPPGLERERARRRLPRMEGRRKVVGVKARRVDRGLKVVAEDDVAEKDVQGPLVLLVAPRCSEREIRTGRRGARVTGKASSAAGSAARATPAGPPRARTSARACRVASRALRSRASSGASRRSGSPRRRCRSGRRRRDGPCRRGRRRGSARRRRPRSRPRPASAADLHLRAAPPMRPARRDDGAGRCIPRRADARAGRRRTTGRRRTPRGRRTRASRTRPPCGRTRRPTARRARTRRAARAAAGRPVPAPRAPSCRP